MITQLLVGYPLTLFEIKGKVKNGEKVVTKKKWVSTQELEKYVNSGWVRTEAKPKMTYAPPEWVANKTGSGILLLDDFNRCSEQIMQAAMDLIYEGKYLSWSLPEDWHIILTSNPDDTGDYLVMKQDDAQKDRYFEYNMKFDEEDWAQWAEANHIDDRCINFLLMNPEAVYGVGSTGDDEGGEDAKLRVTARAWTMYFATIGMFDNWSENLTMVRAIGDASVKKDATDVFVNYINTGEDKLITPKEIFEKPVKEVIRILKETVGHGDDYRSDRANVISTRIVNYIDHYLNTNKTTDKIIATLKGIISGGIVNDDISYSITLRLFHRKKRKLAKLWAIPEVVKYTTRL